MLKMLMNDPRVTSRESWDVTDQTLPDLEYFCLTYFFGSGAEDARNSLNSISIPGQEELNQ
jgi:hypothetical protein